MNRVEVQSEMVAHQVTGYGSSVDIDVVLKYRARDPWAVTACLSSEGVTVEWLFAREDLGTGLIRSAGEGDVHIWPVWSRKSVMACRTSEHGSVTLELDERQVRAFLVRSTALVPYGEESMNVDWLVAQILSKGMPA